ncbi:hypothetical protein Y032_0014g2398 [Ancylostoma ceylanicum]|uniref:Uncharacterized protein n=1 Tax=Ancylostoma ceylanicum TaxID=53326 RepID=A0A016VBY8_9BILA|nr:hypothetical protein Y032_0014g2398 [Ancylostoma ceylanicum]
MPGVVPLTLVFALISTSIAQQAGWQGAVQSALGAAAQGIVALIAFFFYKKRSWEWGKRRMQTEPICTGNKGAHVQKPRIVFNATYF